MNDAATEAPTAKPRRAAAGAPTAFAAVAETGAAGAAATTKARVIKHIAPATAVLRQYANNAWFAIAPDGTLPQDFDMNAVPFELIAANLTRFDDVRITDPAGTWCADYIVIDQSPAYALLRLVQAITIPPRRADQSDRIPSGFSIAMAPAGDPFGGFQVIRDADGVILSAGHFLGSKGDAITYLNSHATVRGNHTPTIFGKR